MCDTLAALPAVTAAHRLIFAKNSDRERNEAQAVEWIPASVHPPDAELRATYIVLQQARRTRGCLICRPYWMWGAEMGVNDAGVAIGNEAVHAVIPAARRPALTGMDLVRLALERSASADEATKTIIDLLERHGQGGDCGHLSRFYYHNSFLIADRSEAFVLETVGRDWALERVAEAAAISNAYAIGKSHIAASAALAPHSRLDFASRFADSERERTGFGRGRCERAGQLLAARRGAMTLGDAMAILRDHGEGASALPRLTPPATPARTICMHAGAGRRSQTVGSLVCEPESGLAWVTASAAPCHSVFKPVVIGQPAPDQDQLLCGRFDHQSRWWRHERWRRAAGDLAPDRAADFAAERDRLEQAFVARMDAVGAVGKNAAGISAAARECWREADGFERAIAEKVLAGPSRPLPGPNGRSWARLNHVAAIPALARQ